MNPEMPFEGDVPGDGDEPSYEWLDEWLCEYVDGTMDPSLEAVFEQYVEANPELKAHVERLQQTRELLCNCGRPTTPSEEMEAEICREVDCDQPRSAASVPETVHTQPLVALGLVSSVAAALAIGFLVGAMVTGPVSSNSSSEPSRADAAAVEAEPDPPSLRRTQTTADRDEPRAPLPLAPIDSAHAPSPIRTTGTR